MKNIDPFHKRLKSARIKRGLSQQQLAGAVGIDVKTVSRWESGAAHPRPYAQQKLCSILEKTREELGLTELNDGEEPAQQKMDWGEAPREIPFYGRSTEQDILSTWITQEQCRLIAVLGIGGIGKTTLVAKVAEQVQEEFEFVFWRSLQNAPPLEQILQQFLQFVSPQPLTTLAQNSSHSIHALLQVLQTRRCLLVLDNFESVLQAEQHVGQYREGYENYGQLLQNVGMAAHRSCLILTSREKPREIARLEAKDAPVRAYSLQGVEQTTGQELLRDKDLSGAAEDWSRLVEVYSGNPLALKVVSAFIHELFRGDIAQFLQSNEIALADIASVLDEQFQRLNEYEREILYWLAIEREEVSLDEILANCAHPIIYKGELLSAFISLRRRFLVESRDGVQFFLQPVILEYITNKILKQAHTDFLALRDGGTIQGIWSNYALIKAQAKDYVRDSQKRLILAPIAQKLLTRLGEEGIKDKLRMMLAAQWRLQGQDESYVAGNVLNLLLHLRYEVRDFNFSQQVIRQAYLQNATLTDVNFSFATFRDVVFSNNFGNILCVAFHPQKDWLAAGATNGSIWIYDAGTGAVQHILHKHTDSVWSLAFHPREKLLASGSDDQTIRLWDLESEETIKTLGGHMDRVRSVVFSPDGTMLASGSEDKTIRLWDKESGTCTKVLEGHSDRVWSIAFSPDGEMLASGSTDGTVRLWDVKSGQCRKVLEEHTNWVRAIAFSTDGKMLASASDDRTVRIWQVKDGECIQTLKGHSHGVWSVAFSPDSSMVTSGSEDKTVCVWNVGSGECSKVLNGHTEGIRSVIFNANGMLLASGGEDQTIHLWDLTSGNSLKTLRGYTNRVWSVDFGADGKTLVSSSEDRAIRLWDVDKGSCSRAIEERKHGVRCAVASPKSALIASSGEDQTVRLWDGKSGRRLNVLSGHTTWVRTVAFSRDGTLLASGGENGSIYLWDVRKPENAVKQAVIEQGSWIRSVAFNADGTIVAAGSDDYQIRLWDVRTKELVRVISGHSGRVRAVAFSPDGTMLASGSEDKMIQLWQVATGVCIATFEGHTNRILALAFSPDGEILASGSEDGTVRLWQRTSGECIAVLEGHSARVRTIAMSPDGRMLASGSDDTAIKLWDIQSTRCLKTLISERPYERMNISNVRGLIEAEKTNLRALGAIEQEI